MKGLSSELFLFQLVALMSFIIMMLTVFSIKANLHLQEELLTDPSLPLLQSISYASVDLTEECSGTTDCKDLRVYDFLALSAAGSKKVVEVCGGTCDVSSIIESRLDNYATDLGDFGFFLKDLDREVIFEVGRTPTEVGKTGKTITEVKATEYLIPLPMEQGEAQAAYCLLMEVKAE